MDYDAIVKTLKDWCELTTGRGELENIHKLLEKIADELSPICDKCIIERLTHPSSEETSWMLIAHRRREAKSRVLLFGHADTVYDQNEGFNKVHLERSKLYGPGVTDMKSGLYTLVEALKRFEIVPHELGWSVAINSDEEFGSPMASSKWLELAKICQVGLGFEPSLPSHSLASERLGSSVIGFKFQGKGAHVGRNPQEGRSALHAAATWIYHLNESSSSFLPNLWFNVGAFSSPMPSNVVAHEACFQVNVRFKDQSLYKLWVEKIEVLSQKMQTDYEITIERQVLSYVSPKLQDRATQKLIELTQKLAQESGLKLGAESTGGVCDGNRLKEFGLTNLDNLGPLGGSIHSHQEWLDLKSIPLHIDLTHKLLTAIEKCEHL